jgi:ribosomal protein L7/L12
MNITRKNIIIATEKIIDLSGDERRKLLLTLLETNPTCVLRALQIGVAIPLFKVVLTTRGADKINVIRGFREFAGAGLADAKEWSEGKTYWCGDKQLPSGVFGHSLTRVEAEAAQKRLNTIFSFSPVIKTAIIGNDVTVNPLPMTWCA